MPAKVGSGCIRLMILATSRGLFDSETRTFFVGWPRIVCNCCMLQQVSKALRRDCSCTSAGWVCVRFDRSEALPLLHSSNVPLGRCSHEKGGALCS